MVENLETVLQTFKKEKKFYFLNLMIFSPFMGEKYCRNLLPVIRTIGHLYAELMQTVFIKVYCT